ncbi:MAG: hypothetical protein KKF68_00600 [Nanoarchaeota archaeon]|nr:hypothetical protein [Nanoarchaeota archaeon]
MKIRIFGGIASGKSTLAKYLSEHLQIPVFCTDDFVYTPKFGKRRIESERIKLIHKKLKSSWIVEGVHFAKWVEYTYKNSDIIIIIDLPKSLLAKRILKRTFNEEKHHYSNKFLDSVRLLWMMFRDTSKEIKEYIQLAKRFNKKHLIIRNNDYAEILKRID